MRTRTPVYVDLVSPTAGNYLVLVSIYQAVPATAFGMTTTSVRSKGAGLMLKPGKLKGQQGVPVSYQASWKKLKPQTGYLGLIGYGKTGGTGEHRPTHHFGHRAGRQDTDREQEEVAERHGRLCGSSLDYTLRGLPQGANDIRAAFVPDSDTVAGSARPTRDVRVSR